MSRPTWPRLLLASEFCDELRKHPAQVLANLVGAHESQVSLLINNRSVAATPLALDRLSKLAVFLRYTGSIGTDLETGSPLPPDLKAGLVVHRERTARDKGRR